MREAKPQPSTQRHSGSLPTRLMLSAALIVLGAQVLFAQNAISSSWENEINSVMGMKGEVMPDGVLRFDLPRTDLHVTLNGVLTLPNLVTDGYAAYKQESGGTLLVAELCLLESEANGVINVLRKNTPAGINFTAHHNHLMNENPRLVFIHFTGFGDPQTLAGVVEQTLAQTSEPRTNDDNQQDADDTVGGFNVKEVKEILGGTASEVDGVLEITIPCGAKLTNAGHDFPSEMGPETELHFQSLGNGQALATPEICVLNNQIDAVTQVLKANGFTQTALHNHWTKDEPHVFFIHAYQTGDAVQLAKALKAAVDLTH